MLTAAWISGPVRSQSPPPGSEAPRHWISSVIHRLKGAKFWLETRIGKSVLVDAAAAVKAERSATFSEGTSVAAEGTLDKVEVLHAERVRRIKTAHTMGPEDR
jgi:hypothetical protein